MTSTRHASGDLPRVVDRRQFDHRLAGIDAPTAVVVVNVVTVNLDAGALTAIEDHLRATVRGNDVIGRLSDRQLAFTCPASVVHVVVRRVRDQLEQPIRIGDRVRLITFTITQVDGSPRAEDLLWRAAVQSQADAHKVMHDLFSRTMRTTTSVDELGALVACSGASFGARGVRLRVEDQVFEAGDTSGEPSLRLDLSDGSGQRRTHESWSDLDPDGHPAFVSALRSALAHQIRRVLDLEEATRIAHTDPLTGVGNRAGIARAVEGLRGPVAVAMVDVDHFKAVNDRFGHEAGDRVLAALGHQLLTTSPAEAIVGRWGGEEFLLAVADEEPVALRAAVEGLRNRCRDAVTVGGRPITFSAGVAVASSFDEARSLADLALYEAKAQGRDRVVVASP